MPQTPSLPPIAKEPLSVVLLAHNNAADVEAVLAAWVAFLDGLGRDYELLFVDDGSSDGTANRAEEVGQRAPRLRVLRREEHGGEGAALRTGVAAANRPLLFYTLCDPQYRPADLGRLLDKRSGIVPSAGSASPPSELELDHVHLMSGYRAGVPVPAWLRVVGWLWRAFCWLVFSYPARPLPGWLGWNGHAERLLVRALFAVRYQDVSCPFRLLRREALRRIPIQSDGPFAHIEVLAKANFLGHVMGEELPLDVRPGPPSDLRAMWRELRRVWRAPDFGPAVLPEEKTGTTVAEAGPSGPAAGPGGGSG
jgi:glycosyltransferase involved in cell wall biosynthesis